jgi:hypothetical protein
MVTDLKAYKPDVTLGQPAVDRSLGGGVYLERHGFGVVAESSTGSSGMGPVGLPAKVMSW